MTGIAAIILAAGFSRRLGRPKQDVMLGGLSLLERAVRVAGEARLFPVLVVVQGTTWDALLCALGAQPLRNPAASEGMAASVRVGIAAAQAAEVAGAVVMTCDQPLLRAEHLLALCQEPARVTASGYAGRKGVPAYFPAASFAELRTLQGDAGARELLRHGKALQDESLALDVDTAEDLLRARQALGC